ncbi:DUF3558 family protein [Saccharothrix variisporea]|uniref:Uncharacterized protein DUF3558 n=1 Tax=Saccharothrix variisporea TaxID=543527 RepID=A0A495XH27_9PSEU|nr:DUF3558 family protein [Saccharothrix variisporea]RKT71863.1 uncharacterized protein DUF3558 [Saccharothrix variisporea]
MTRSILTIAAAALLLAGCTSKEPGDPTARSTATTTAASGQSTTTSKPSSGDNLLADYDPCDELNAIASQVSLTEIEEDGRQECKARWGQTTTVVRVKAFPELGIGEIVGGANSKFTDLSIGSHKARKVTAPSSSTSCAVTVEVSAKSRVDVVASATSSQDEACDAAQKVATAIEPKLPK